MRQCQDPHWNQQILRMKPKNWKRINFVGHFENMHDTRRLLMEIGAYEEFARLGRVRLQQNVTLCNIYININTLFNYLFNSVNFY